MKTPLNSYFVPSKCSNKSFVIYLVRIIRLIRYRGVKNSPYLQTANSQRYELNELNEQSTFQRTYEDTEAVQVTNKGYSPS